MELYHVGFNIIDEIDLKRGRINADFGQGFYLSPNLDFSKKWAGISNDHDTIINYYSLSTEGLKILEFKEKNKEWLDYIFKNRNGYKDLYKEYDLIIGPISNDTIFDLYGIITSGLINKDTALKILDNAPLYYQVVIKTDKAKSQLKFLKYEVLDKEIIKNYLKEIKKLEEKYQDLMFSLLDDKARSALE